MTPKNKVLSGFDFEKGLHFDHIGPRWCMFMFFTLALFTRKIF